MSGPLARAFWVVEPGRGEIREEGLPDPSADDIIVNAAYSGISRGTEALVFAGRVPPSEYERMRAPFQCGEFPAPVKYGYASVGLVQSGPRELQGRHVFSLYPHQTRYVVPRAAAYPIPEGVPPQRAVLAANMETALNGIWDAEPHVGDRIAVVGAGTVGCLAAWLAARIIGCDVLLIDVNQRRADVADALNVRFSPAEVAAMEADVVIHASGTGEGLALALRLASFEAAVVELSWYGDRRPSVPLGEAFHSRRLRLVSSQVGRVAPAQRSRWDSRRRMDLALRLLAHRELDALITGESEFGDLPDTMSKLASDPGDVICHRIRYA
jgi:2-desacetyl-2-hydroxyethyl bacteriochlorophyllide A dehydrogenase